MITIAQARIARSSGVPAVLNGDPALITDIYDAPETDAGWMVGFRVRGWEAVLEPKHLEPGKALLDLIERGDYDSAGYAEGEVSPEQTLIYQQAEDLIELLRQSVPSTTVHWAVEEARRALRDLSKHHGSITTYDRLAPPAVEEDDPRGYQGQMPAENQLLP